MGHFTLDELAAQLKDAQPRGKCQHEEKRADALALVQQDVARLLCTIINYFTQLVIKHGELALVIGTRGDLRSLTVTLELMRHRQRIGIFSYSDPVLRAGYRHGRDCMVERKGKHALKIHACAGSLASLLAMRALLYAKLPAKGRVLTLPAD
jgi:hypothetical protein